MNWSYLCERQWLRCGSTRPTYTLLDQCHRKLAMRYAVSRTAHILRLAMGNMRMQSQQHIFETFGRIVHVAQLETTAIEEILGEGATQRVRG